MLFSIRHLTRYAYDPHIAEAYGELRMTPPSLPAQTIIQHKLHIEPDTQTSTYTDYFGNHVTFFSHPHRFSALLLENFIQVRTQAVTIPSDSLECPVQETRQILGSRLTDIFAYLEPTRIVPLTRESTRLARRHLPGRAPLGPALTALNTYIHRTFRYLPGSTDTHTPLAQVWKNRTGVCQDFAHILLSILRSAGLPARYVCGYIETDTPPGADPSLIGATATHAWVEVLLPGFHWAGLDPTNNQWTGPRHVTVSYGTDATDAAPFIGAFKGAGVRATLTAEVHMTRLPEASPDPASVS